MPIIYIILLYINIDIYMISISISICVCIIVSFPSRKSQSFHRFTTPYTVG